MQLQLASVILPGAGALRRAGGGGVKRGDRPCTRCSLLTSNPALCLSFSCLHPAVGVSFDIKKACGKPYKYLFLLQFLVIKTLDPDPYPDLFEMLHPQLCHNECERFQILKTLRRGNSLPRQKKRQGAQKSKVDS